MLKKVCAWWSSRIEEGLYNLFYDLWHCFSQPSQWVCIKNISCDIFKSFLSIISDMRLIFSICHEIEKLNYYSNTPLPTISSGLWAEPQNISEHPPSPGGSGKTLIRKLAQQERMNRNNIRVAGPEVINKTCINGKIGQQECSHTS